MCAGEYPLLFSISVLKATADSFVTPQISKLLAPAEELSPFKLGQIQKLISDMFVPYQLSVIHSNCILLSHILFTLPTLATLAMK